MDTFSVRQDCKLWHRFPCKWLASSRAFTVYDEASQYFPGIQHCATVSRKALSCHRRLTSNSGADFGIIRTVIAFEILATLAVSPTSSADFSVGHHFASEVTTHDSLEMHIYYYYYYYHHHHHHHH